MKPNDPNSSGPSPRPSSGTMRALGDVAEEKRQELKELVTQALRAEGASAVQWACDELAARGIQIPPGLAAYLAHDRADLVSLEGNLALLRSINGTVWGCLTYSAKDLRKQLADGG